MFWFCRLIGPRKFAVEKFFKSATEVCTFSDLTGFYIVFVFSSEGEERYACSTMFEPSDARRCFPCWDEPAHKATFDITLIVPKDRTAISNMVSDGTFLIGLILNYFGNK